MVTYMVIPQNQIVVGASTFNNEILGAKISLYENGFNQATLTFSDEKSTNRSTLTAGSVVSCGVKDASEGTYTNLLSGVARFDTETINPETVTLKCESAGFGLAECLCGQEYGVQSSNTTLDTIKEILTDATAGIIPKWVHKILNTATDTGYSFDTSKVETITGSINYIYFPFKPTTKCIGDLCNIVQAIKGTNAGCHWIVTTSGSTNYFRCKLVDGTQTGWTKYYGNSQANATLTQGTDFLDGSFETLTSEANYILYHSPFIWPGDGDYRTEIGITTYWTSPAYITVSEESTIYKKGVKSVKALITSDQSFQNLYYSTASDLNLDLTKAGGQYNIPTFNFWIRVNSTFDLANPSYLDITFWKTAGGSPVYSVAGILLDKVLSGADVWAHVSFPIGPYWLSQYEHGGAFQGIADVGGTNAAWDDINNIEFTVRSQPVDAAFYIDGMSISGYVLRGAYNSTKITASGLKTRVVNDPFGKDDTLIASDDSGNAARLAYAELLRTQTTPTVGAITTPMIKDLLPGQFLHIHARLNSAGTYQINMDMRVTQVTHHISKSGYTSNISLTSDVTNSFARAAYDSQNEVSKAQRPEFQDRQTTGIKMRDIDITQPILAKDYPS